MKFVTTTRYPRPARNEIRKQTQVYIVDEGAGW